MYFLCHCLSCAVPVFCLFWSVETVRDRFAQGFIAPRIVDDLESVVTCWRRDHLSAIRLLGNLFQTTLAPDDFPSDPNSPLLSCEIPKATLLTSILLPNTLEHYWLALHRNSVKPLSSYTVKCVNHLKVQRQIAERKKSWTHWTQSRKHTKRRVNLSHLKKQPNIQQYGVFPLVMLWNACALAGCIFPLLFLIFFHLLCECVKGDIFLYFSLSWL